VRRMVNGAAAAVVAVVLATVASGCGPAGTERASEQRIDTAARETTQRWSEVVDGLDRAGPLDADAGSEIDLSGLSPCDAAGVAAIFVVSYEIRWPFLHDAPIWPAWEEQLASLLSASPRELRDEIDTIRSTARSAMAPYAERGPRGIDDPDVQERLRTIDEVLEDPEVRAAVAAIERSLLECPHR